MRDIADTPYLATIAQTTRATIGKRFAYASKIRSDGVWRETDVEGLWRKPQDIGAGSDTTANQKKFMFRVIPQDHTLEYRKMMRDELHKNAQLALVMGVLAPDYAKELEEVGDHFKMNRLLPRLSRRAPVLVDAPRAFLTVDMDGLSLPHIDVVEADAELPDLIADQLDQAGLDWLITDCVIQLSSGHGLLNRHDVKVHIDWHLDTPLTLAEQHSLVKYINAQAAEAGISPRLVDSTVYDPSRLLFTGPVYLFKRIFVPGRGIKEVEASARELGAMQRVRIVSRGQGRVKDIPKEAFNEVEVAKKLAKIRKSGFSQARRKGLTTAGRGRATKLEPGNVYFAVRSRIFAVARSTPSHLEERVKSELQQKLYEEICALPDHAERGARRVRFISDSEFDRSWRGARAARYGWTISTSQSHAYPAPVSIEAARSALKAHIARALKEGIEYANEDTSDVILRPRAKHVLVHIPPGVGKTESVVSAVRSEYLMGHRISYLAPTARLSAEATARLRERVAEDDYTQSRVRHHRGREALCREPEYNRLAKQVEANGLSPLPNVCAHCPQHDVCVWPAQQSDKESGFIAGQHAHATTTLAKIKSADSDAAPAFGIVDESMLDTLVSERISATRIQSLRRVASRAKIYKRDGSLNQFRSIDLVSYRVDVLDVLSKSSGVMRTAATAKLLRLVEVRRGESVTRVTQISDSLDMELRYQGDLRKRIQGEMSRFHEARSAGEATREYTRSIQKYSLELKASDFFESVYRAIQASLDIKGRKHVFGVRVKNNRVSVHIRSKLPRVMNQRHWIWLDGTADPEVWAALMGEDVETTQVSLDVMPGPYRLTQFPDRSYSKRMFEGGTDDAKSNVRKMARYIKWQAARHKDVLVVCQLGLENKLRDLALPSNVNVEHYNALRGLDRYKNVSCAIIVGRPMPANNILEVMTEALHYDNPEVVGITPAEGQQTRTQIELPIAGHDRSIAIINVESHPDPRVQAMRRQIVDAEVRQAIMRLRLFDRTKDNPAEIIVFGQTNTGLIANELRDWVDAERTSMEVVIASGILSTSDLLIRRVAHGELGQLTTEPARRIIRSALKEVAWPEWEFFAGNRKHKARFNPNMFRSCMDVQSALEDLGVSVTRAPKKRKERLPR